MRFRFHVVVQVALRCVIVFVQCVDVFVFRVCGFDAQRVALRVLVCGLMWCDLIVAVAVGLALV